MEMYDYKSIVEIIEIHFDIYEDLTKDEFEHIKERYSNYD